MKRVPRINLEKKWCKAALTIFSLSKNTSRWPLCDKVHYHKMKTKINKMNTVLRKYLIACWVQINKSKPDQLPHTA